MASNTTQVRVVKTRERLELKDVLRTLAQGDDLWVWLRLADGSIEVLRLDGFFSQQAQLWVAQENQAPTWWEVPQQPSAQDVVTVAEREALAELNTDATWLDMSAALLSDWAMVDSAWTIDASAVAVSPEDVVATAPELGALFLSDTSASLLEPVASFLPVPPRMALDTADVFINARHLAQGAQFSGEADARLGAQIDFVGQQGRWTLRVAAGELSWPLTLTGQAIAQLGEGPVEVVWTYLNAQGQAMGAPYVSNWVVDTLAPAVPVIRTPEPMVDGALTLAEAQAGVRWSGTAEPGGTVELRWSDGTLMTRVSVGADGSWVHVANLADLGGQRDELRTLRAISTDAAGNPSEAAEIQVPLHTAPPAAPTATLVDNNPLRWGSLATSDDTPAFQGDGPAGGKVTWFLLSPGANPGDTRLEPLAEATVDSAGGYDLSLPALTTGQTHVLMVRATDRFGNVSESMTRVELQIDVQAPSAPVLNAVGDDDRLAYFEVQRGALVTGEGEPGSRIEIERQQGTAKRTDVALVGSDGRWSLNWAADDWATLETGDVQVRARQVDPAGNASDWSAQRSVVVRLTPVAPVESLFVVSGDDTGVSSSDGVTRNTAPTLTGTALPNSTVRLVIDADGDGALSSAEASQVLAELGVNASGVFRWSGWSQALPHGASLRIVALGWDPASGTWSNADPSTGLPANVPSSARLHLQVDTVAPDAPRIDVVAGNDVVDLAEMSAGVSFSGTAEPGSQVTVSWVNRLGQPLGLTPQTVLADAVSGRWSVLLDNSALAVLGSDVRVQVQVSDLAGNTGNASVAARDFSVDTSRPAAPSVLQLSSDTGASATDGLTRDTEQVISGTAVAGATVTIFNDANSDGVADGSEVLAVVTADGNGAFSTAALQLPEGSYQLRAVATVAGIDSVANTARAVRVDTTAPSVSMTDVAGAAPGAGRINIATVSAGTTFGGAAENGASVTLRFLDSDQQPVVLNGEALSYTTSVSGGSWQVTLTPAQLTELAQLVQGPLTAVATQVDAAGNVGVSTQSVMLDTVRPGGQRSQMATALDLQNQGELGGGVQWTELVDGLQVHVALPDNLGAGGQVTLKWGTQSVNHSVTADELAQGYAVVTVPANAVIGAGQGDTAVTAVFTDAAGNTGVEMGVTNANLSDSRVNVDFSGRPPGLVLDPESYHRIVSGTYHSRAVQGVALQLSGVAGSEVTIKEGNNTLAVATLDVYGQASVVVTLSPSATPYTLTAQAPGTQASSVSVVIDNVRPQAPGLDALADTLINAIERNQGVEISGSCDDSAEISYWLFNTVTGVVSDTVTVPASGNRWSAYISLEQWFQVGDGTLRLFVTQTDWAGNVSDPVETRLTLDTAVLSPVVNAVADDDRINAAEVGSVVLRGAAEPGAQVDIDLQGASGTISKTLTADPVSGLWVLSLAASDWATLGEGAIRLAAVQTDLAGNASVSTIKNLTLDTVSSGLSLNALAGDDHLNLAERSFDQTLSGRGEAGATIQVSLGALSRTVLVSSTGSWSTTFTAQEVQALTNGTSLSVHQTDLAGNTSALNQTITVNTNAMAGVVSMSSPTSVVAWGDQASALQIRGTGPMGARVYLQLVGAQGVVELGPATVNTNAQWSLDLSSAQMRNVLGPGGVVVKLWAVDGSGLQSTEVADTAFTLASQIPSPTLQSVAEDGVINEAERLAGAELSGTGVPGHTIEVSFSRGNSQVLMLSTQVAANGVWTLPLSDAHYNAIGQGAVAVSVVQVSAGLSSVPVNTSVTIDTVPPGAPSATSLTLAQTANAAGELVNGVTAAEAVDGVTVVLPLPINVAAGDTVELFWGSNNEPAVRYVLRANDIAASDPRTLSLTVPGDEIALRGSVQSGDLSISYRITDAAGNADIVRTLVSGLSVDAPPLAPQFNAVGVDGFVNRQEYTQAASIGLVVNGQVSGSGALTLQLSGALGSLTRTPTVSAGSWSLALTQADLDALGEGLITLSAQQVVAGVASPVATSSFVFDKTAPAAPSADNIRLALEKNADTELAGGLLATASNNNLTEAYDGTLLHVPLAADATSGDVLQVFWNSQMGAGGSLVDIVLTASDILRGYAVVAISEAVITQAGDNAQLRVEARSIDRAGNEGERYEVWTGPVDAVPAAPLLGAVATDGIVNIQEMAGSLVFSGRKDANSRLEVQLVKGNQTIGFSRSADGMSDWSWTLSADEKLQLANFGQGVFEFRARQVDDATVPGMPGNPSRWATANVLVDTVAPNRPTVFDVTADNRIGSSEAQSVNGVRVRGQGEPGATVLVEFFHGNALLQSKSGITVNSDGEWDVLLTASDFSVWPVNTGSSGVQIDIRATQSDVAGNPSQIRTKTFTYSDDVVLAPADVLVEAVDTVNHPNALQDGFLNAAEAQAGLRVSGTGQAGRWVRVTVTVGDVATDLPLVAVDEQGQWSLVIQGAALTALGQGPATVQAVQRNGVTSNADESTSVMFDTLFDIDTVVPTLQSGVLAVIDDTTGLPLPHAQANDVLLVRVRLSEGATLTAGVPRIALGLASGAEAVYDPVRSEELGANWLVFAYTVQPGDNALEGALGQNGLSINWNGARVTEAAGNVLTGADVVLQRHAIRVDTDTPNAPTVLDAMVAAAGEAHAADAGASVGGAVINVAELTGGKAIVRVNLASGVLANDKLVIALRWASGAQTASVDRTLLQADIDAGFALVALPAGSMSGVEANDFQIRAQVQDVAGNTSAWSSWSASWTLDTLPPTTPVIGQVAGDDRMSASERLNLSAVNVTGLVSGNTVMAWIEGIDVVTQQPVQRSVNVVAGQISVSELNAALTGLSDGNWTLKVHQTDAAGNVSITASRVVAMDTNVPGQPSLTVTAANDGWVNIAETANGLSVTVDLRNTRTKTGDQLVFRWTDAASVEHEHRHTLLSGQANTLLSLGLPAAFVTQAPNVSLADPFALSVQIEDTGGNTSGMSTLSGKQLDTFVTAPLIDAASLNTVTAVAAKSNGTFSGSGAEAGATVEVLLTSATTGQVRRMSTVADNSGVYAFTLTSSDYKDLGGSNATSTIAVSVVQTDLAGNRSAAGTGSFRLDLALAPPTFFDLTGDNLVNASEANVGQLLSGTGSPGAVIQIQFFDASADASAAALLTISNIAVNSSTGRWQTTITPSQFITLAGGSNGSNTLRAVATQALGGSTSDPGVLQFDVDMTTPMISGLVRFDANGDGGNNDGLVLTLSEPVKASRMTQLGSYSVGAGESLGTGARIEAIDTVSRNGSTYAQHYRIYLGNDHTLSGNETLSLLAGNVEDLRGNSVNTNLTVTVPTLGSVGRPIPPLVIALDNVISGSEASGGFNIPFTIPATQAANSFLRFYVNGVQVQVMYNAGLVLDVPLSSTQTNVILSIPQNNWGGDGSKTIAAQVVINPGSVNERTSMFSSSKIALLDTSVDGVVQSMVLVQHDSDSLLEAGERIRLTFKESVKLGAASLSSVFGVGATLTAVAPFNGYAQQWDVTLGTNPTLVPGQNYGMSTGVLTAGVRYIMVRNNPSPTDALSFGELIVLDVNGNNIAKGKITTASSSFNAQYDKSKIVDGDATGSETSSWGGATTGDQWVQVDLGQTYDVNAIVVVPRNNFGEAKSFTVFAGGTDMSTQSYAALAANSSLYQHNYSSATPLTSPLVLGQAVVAIDNAGNIAGSLSASLPANLMSIPQSGYIDTVSTDNVLSASDMTAAAIEVKIVLNGAQANDVVKLFVDGQEVGSRTLAASDILNGSVNVSVSRGDWGPDGERMLQTTVVRGAISSELSVARMVYVQSDHAHWSMVRDGSAIWFDPDTLASQGLGAAVTNWRASVGGSTASNSDTTQRPTLIRVNGRYALNFDGANDNLNYTDPLSVIPKAANASVGYDISGFVAIQSQTAAGGFRSALSYWGDTPGTGVARGVKLGIRNTELTYTTYSLLDFYGPSNSVSPNSTTVLTLRDYYDSGAMAYRMQGYNLNVQDINQTGNNSRINMTVAPTAMRIGADTNYGIRAFWQGMIGDAIWLNYKVTDAQMFEIQTYLAAKYASVGFWVNDSINGVYRLDTSTQSSPLIDQRVDFRGVVANETVKLAGSDYVQTGRGDDVIQIKDLFFRYVDAGQGLDTLQWAVDYVGPSNIVLSDFVSNVRGLSGNTTDDSRVNAAGYHELLGLERLDLRQIGLVSGAVENQILTMSAVDVKQLSESNQIEVLLGANDVLKTSGFTSVTYGNFSLNNQFYGERHLGFAVDGTRIEMYVRGGQLTPDPFGASINGSAVQIDFNTSVVGNVNLVDFNPTSWGVSRGVDLTALSFLNNRQSLYMEFGAAVTTPLRVEYRGTGLKDEFGRGVGHSTWGVGTEGSDILDASGWDAAVGAVLLAGGGNDSLRGTAGNDMIVGGFGADSLTGGGGSDRFVYKNITSGAGGTGGLGGTGGDVITDFNTDRNSTNADVLDLSELFQLPDGTRFTGDAGVDTQLLRSGGYMDLVRTNSGRDLQVWVDRDGGGVTGLLVTLTGIGVGTGNYFTVENESSEQLLQRLLTEGRFQVTHA